MNKLITTASGFITTLKSMHIENDIDCRARLLKDEDPDHPVLDFKFKRTFKWSLIKTIVVVLCAIAAIDLLITGLVVSKHHKQ